MSVQDRRDEVLVRHAYKRFALLSVVLIALVVIGIVVVTQVQADRVEQEDAATRGEIVAAAVRAGLEDADRPPTDRSFSGPVETAATRVGVRAVLVWDEQGRVVWSTRDGLVGETYELDPQRQERFGTAEALAVEGRLAGLRLRGLMGDEIQVLSPIKAAGGELFVVESYVDPSVLADVRFATVRQLLPIGVGSVVLFELLALLTAAQLTRQVRASRRDRIKLLTDSLAAVDYERRRLAHDLHDGVIQDLAAMRYAISGVVHSVPTDLPGEPRAKLRRVCDLIEEELVTLRGTLGDLLPIERQDEPLPQSLHHVVKRVVPQPVAWSVTVDPGLQTVDAGTAELVARVVQEGVRNAVRHADPGSVSVRVLPADERAPSWVRVEIEDDGAGVGGGDTGGTVDSVDGTHVGIRLLRDLVRDLDGDLSLSPRPDGGTRLVAEWPQLVPDHSPLGRLGRAVLG